MSDQAAARIETMLAAAVEAHRGGRIDQARHEYDAVLAQAPDHGWANYFRGLVAEHDGDARAATHYFRRAAAATQAPVQAFVALGNAQLAADQPQSALAAFDAAIARRPRLAAAYTGRTLALKQLGRLEDAAAAGAEALRLRRAWQPDQAAPPGELDPAERAEMRRANRIKLNHDAAQLRYLHKLGRLDDKALAIAAAGEALAQSLAELNDDTATVELDDHALQRLQFAYNRLLYWPEATPPVGGALDSGTDFAAADVAFTASRPSPVVIDQVLSPEALDRLQAFCREATIWFEVKDHGGHLGAYFEEGLARPLLIGVARQLQAALPRSLGGLRLAQLWAYKHSPNGTGTDLHADIGTVSANLWIAPDEPPADGRGGMEIWPQRLPDGWDFRRANVERDGIRRLLAQSGERPQAIPYRCNRLVLFGANLFHRSCPGAFPPGYEHRRVNITFLFK